MLKTALSLLCLAFLALAPPSSASDVEVISLPFGNFENVDLEASRQTNRIGCFSFTRNGWEMAPPEDVASGKGAITITRPLTFTVAIPPALKRHSLMLSFKGKGTCNFKVDYQEHQTDARGAIIRHLNRKLPLSIGILPKTTLADFQTIQCFGPPMDSKTTRVTFTIGQQKTPFHLDDITLTAHRIPFFQQGKPLPLPDSVYSFPTHPWTHKHSQAKSVKDQNGMVTKLQIWHGFPVYLPLPLEQFRDKWLGLTITGRGNHLVNVELLTGKTGKAPCSFHSHDRLINEETVIHVWFHPAGPQADDLKLMIKPNQLVEITDIKIFSSDTPLLPHLLTSDDIKAGLLPETDYLVGANPPHPGLVNVAPYAEIVCNHDYVLRRNAPIDGSLGSGTRLPLYLRFPTAVEVSEIRLTLPYTHMTFWADTKGNGVYDTLIADHQTPLKILKIKELGDYVWYRKKLDTPLKLYGLRYRNAGFGRNTHEFQVLATPQAAQVLTPIHRETMLPPTLEGGSPVTMPSLEPKDRLRFGFSLEAWMFDVPAIMRNYYKDKSIPIPPVSEWKHWQRLLADFKTLHANFILLFPPDTTVMPPGVKPKPAPYPAPLMWPSKIWYVSQPINFLRMMADSCRKHDIKLYAIPRTWLFRDDLKNRKDGPVELAKEIAAQGAHGVPICVDEHYYYQKEPKANTPQERKNYLDRLQETADYMRRIKEECATINPQIETFSAFASFYYYKDRLKVVSPHDIWGFEGKADIIGGDGTYFTLTSSPFGSFGNVVGCKEYASLSPGRRVMATQNFNWLAHWNRHQNCYDWPLYYDDYPLVAFCGGALSCYFNKAESLNFWRYNFIDAWGGPATRKILEQTGKMVEVLSAWGGKQAQIPKDVLILRSRTAEDWWNLKTKADNPQYSSTFEGNVRREFHVSRLRLQGWTQFNWCITQLLTNSIPHDIYLLNRPETWKELVAQYKVVILPFTYACSQNAAQAIQQAAKKGVRFIALSGGGLGSVDDMGNPHATGPSLKALVDSGVIEVFDLDVIGTPSSTATDKAFASLLFQRLASRGGPSVSMKRPPHYDIHCHMMECSPREKLILLVNYSERHASVTLGIRVPVGNYRMEICKPASLTHGRIGGKDIVTAQELRHFQISMPREDTQMIRILPVTTESKP